MVQFIFKTNFLHLPIPLIRLSQKATKTWLVHSLTLWPPSWQRPIKSSKSWALILLMVQKSGEHPAGMYKTPIDNGIFTISNWLAGFLPSTVVQDRWIYSLKKILEPTPWNHLYISNLKASRYCRWKAFFSVYFAADFAEVWDMNVKGKSFSVFFGNGPFRIIIVQFWLLYYIYLERNTNHFLTLKITAMSL